MTRNGLIGGVLAGILFLSTLALADDRPKTPALLQASQQEAWKHPNKHVSTWGASLSQADTAASPGPPIGERPFTDTMVRRFGLLSGQVILHTADLLFLASIRPPIFSVAQAWAKSNCMWNL